MKAKEKGGTSSRPFLTERTDNMYDILIIGAGPAGLTAALYAARAGKTVAMYEQLAPGGQIINSPDVANHPGFVSISGAELTMSMMEAASAAGAELHYNKVTDASLEGDVKLLTLDSGERVEGRAVIIANGVTRRTLDVPGEEEFIGRGVSYCATCDGGFYKNKAVAVIGGGNTALDDALYLCSICKSVTLIHRREGFRGSETTLQKLRERKNLQLLLGYVPTVITGADKVEEMGLKNVTTGETKQIKVDGVFVAIGSIPDNEMFSPIMLDNGFLDSGESCKTALPGVFAAGDTRHKELRQLVTAESDGAIAATAAVQYVDSL